MQIQLGQAFLRRYAEICSCGGEATRTASAYVPEGPNLHVGGELFTANKLVVSSPYLALIGVVAVAFVLLKRRKI